MPIISSENDYNPNWLYRFGHLNTVIPNLFRRFPKPFEKRHRIELADGDFLDVDFRNQNGSDNLLLLHGLEGSADAQYVKGMARAFIAQGWNVYAMNYRGCSGEPNRLLRAYHSGATEDIQPVLDWISSQKNGQKIHLIGFSLGGNLTLKYLGENGEAASDFIEKAVAISSPAALFEAVDAIEHPQNVLYNARFLQRLRVKVNDKAAILKGAGIDPSYVRKIKRMRGFDEWYTAPVHGFENAEDYYHKASSLYVLDQIKVPVLMVSAKDDSFLSPKCFPYEIAKHHDYLHLETPNFGGHVGFVQEGLKGLNWVEARCLDFFIGDRNI